MNGSRPTAAAIVRFESVDLGYRGSGARSPSLDVLRDINLSLPEGAFRGLWGGSGSGKATQGNRLN
jgi:ABC-type bacteriocin/lantibiotic exporter with double-glycine peptidase domain